MRLVIRAGHGWRPPTNNAFYRGRGIHTWRQEAAPIKTAAAEAFHRASRHGAIVPSLPLRVAWWGQYPNRRSLPDPGNLSMAAKAAIDGLVEHTSLLDDDTWTEISSVRELRPVIVPGSHPALILDLADRDRILDHLITGRDVCRKLGISPSTLHGRVKRGRMTPVARLSAVDLYDDRELP